MDYLTARVDSIDERRIAVLGDGAGSSLCGARGDSRQSLRRRGLRRRDLGYARARLLDEIVSRGMASEAGDLNEAGSVGDSTARS